MVTVASLWVTVGKKDQTNKMGQMVKGIFFCIATLVLGGCASTINSTGRIENSLAVKTIAIVCTTPENVEKFSSELCLKLKQELKREGVDAAINVVSEMDPSLNSGEVSITTDKPSDIVMAINHVRVTLTYGKPSNTLLDIELFDPKNSSKIWGARIYTQGSNVTGPGNPEKIASQIIAQMKADGLRL